LSSDDWGDLFGPTLKKEESKPAKPTQADIAQVFASDNKAMEKATKEVVAEATKLAAVQVAKVVEKQVLTEPDPFANLGTETVQVQEKKPEGTKVEQKIETPTVQQPRMVPATMVEEFDVSEEPASNGGGKLVIGIYGHKGHSKTATAFSLPGTIACISMDKMSAQIRDGMYRGDKRLRVYDGTRYLDESDPRIFLESSDRSFKYILTLIEEIAKNPPDWLVIDGSEIESQICEMRMRNRNNLTMSSGVEWQLWKERALYLRQIHRKAISVCKRGLVYTMYVDKEEIIKDGETYQKIDRPKWTDILLRETSIVIHVTSEADKIGRHFYAEIESSKSTEFKTGVKMEITNRGLEVFGFK